MKVIASNEVAVASDKARSNPAMIWFLPLTKMGWDGSLMRESQSEYALRHTRKMKKLEDIFEGR